MTNTLFIVIIVAIMISPNSIAGERLPLRDVNTDELINDTRAVIRGAGDNHVALAMWLPNEFWASVLSRDEGTSESDKNALMDLMSGISLLIVVQADISHFGSFSFYTREEIQKNMKLSFSAEEGNKQTLSIVQKIDPDLEMVLNLFKPILGGAMGNLGDHMHFYVLNDKTKSSPRLLDPYGGGQIDIHLTRRDKEVLSAGIDLPVNALFVPRKCPNGKDAHISWKFCPWTGVPLSSIYQE
jgi:hypothetical protein